MKKLALKLNPLARVVIVALSLTAIFVAPAQSAPKPPPPTTSGIDIDFAASYYLSYDHNVGGGAWDSRTVNKDIENSLEGSEFKCNDYVSFLTKISIGDTSDLRAQGQMTLELDYSFDGNTTGQPGLAYTKMGTVQVNRSPIVDNVTGEDTIDSALIESMPLSLETFTAVEPNPAFSNQDLKATVALNNLQAGETIILRTDVKIECQSGSTPSGNILAQIDAVRLTAINDTNVLATPEAVSIGQKTVPLQNPAKVLTPGLTLSKTGVEGSGPCPGGELTDIPVGGSVTFCYVVTNTGSAPLYNITTIMDDNATPGNTSDDFQVSLSGLTNQDSDAIADDLGIGESATASYLKTYNGQKDSYETNTATVMGDSASSGGNKISASDTTVVYIDPPLPLSLTINKLTNGADSSTILVGTPITWTYDLTNTGDAALETITVVDDQGVTVNCPSTTLAIDATMQCTATGTAIKDGYSNVGTVTGYYLGDSATASDSSSYFGAEPKISIVKGPETQTVIESQSATFDITVTNIGNVALESVTVTDPLVSGCASFIGFLAVSETSTYSCMKETVTAGFINTAMVSGMFETTTVNDLDTATVIVDFLPKIKVIKVANKLSIPESGETVTFTFTVTNEGVETLTLTSLVDDVFGDLDGQGNCDVPETISVGGNYICSVNKLLSSNTLTPFTNTVTATGEDPENNSVSDTATAGVTFTDVAPDIELTKIANPTLIPMSGGLVTYNFKITNKSFETVTVSTFIDPKLVLSAQCLGLITQQIAPGAFITCSSSETLTSTTGLPYVNIATVTAYDNEMTVDTATATATVNFTWYGRTPGYWKNHLAAWPSPYKDTMTVTSVFFPANGIPGVLKNPVNTGIFDLNKNSVPDTLKDALSYKGGSDIQGGAQILLRAAVAALLNEAYYGENYPGASSVDDLITQVRNALITINRGTYLALATTLDMWNNGNHSTP